MEAPYFPHALLIVRLVVRLSLIFFLSGTTDSAISLRTLWTIFLAGEDQQQTNQPKDLAGC